MRHKAHPLLRRQDALLKLPEPPKPPLFFGENVMITMFNNPAPKTPLPAPRASYMDQMTVFTTGHIIGPGVESIVHFRNSLLAMVPCFEKARLPYGAALHRTAQAQAASAPKDYAVGKKRATKTNPVTAFTGVAARKRYMKRGIVFKLRPLPSYAE